MYMYTTSCISPALGPAFTAMHIHKEPTCVMDGWITDPHDSFTRACVRTTKHSGIKERRSPKVPTSNGITQFNIDTFSAHSPVQKGPRPRPPGAACLRDREQETNLNKRPTPIRFFTNEKGPPSPSLVSVLGLNPVRFRSSPAQLTSDAPLPAGPVSPPFLPWP